MNDHIEDRQRRIRAAMIDEGVDVGIAHEIATRAAASVTAQPEGAHTMTTDLIPSDSTPDPKPMSTYRLGPIPDDLTAEQAVELCNEITLSDALPERVKDSLTERIMQKLEENIGQRPPARAHTEIMPSVGFFGASADDVEVGLKALARTRTRWGGR